MMNLDSRVGEADGPTLGQEINLMDCYPKANRPITERGQKSTAEHIALAAQFGKDYFDGSRLTGYGGYHYHPRFWTDTVRRFRHHYDLADDARILDVGCAKGFMLHDFGLLMPKADLVGLDISEYALAHAKPEVADNLLLGNARSLPFEDKSFDLVISINTIHNLEPDECEMALAEIARVSKQHAFVMVDAWHNDEEKQRMTDWNLQARTVQHVDDWKSMFARCGYTGDYWWFIAT